MSAPPSPYSLTSTETPTPEPAALTLYAPSSAVEVDTRRPVFTWSAYPGATHYRLIVKRPGAEQARINLRVRAERVCVDNLCTLNLENRPNIRPLPMDRPFQWRVRALAGDVLLSVTGWQAFRVAPRNLCPGPGDEGCISPVPSATRTPSRTPTRTATAPPTATAPSAATATRTPTRTATRTATRTPSRTPTRTPSPTSGVCTIITPRPTSTPCFSITGNCPVEATPSLDDLRGLPDTGMCVTSVPSPGPGTPTFTRTPTPTPDTNCSGPTFDVDMIRSATYASYTTESRQELLDMGILTQEGSGVRLLNAPIINGSPSDFIFGWNTRVKVHARVVFPQSGYPDQVWYRVGTAGGNIALGWLVARYKGNNYIESGDPCSGTRSAPSQLTFTYNRQAAANYAIEHSWRTNDLANPNAGYRVTRRLESNNQSGRFIPFADFTYSNFTGSTSATGSALFISEAIWAGGLPTSKGSTNTCDPNATTEAGWCWACTISNGNPSRALC